MMAASRPDAIVCANDRTAALLMHTLLHWEYAVPGDVRLVGIDDAEYAKLLPVPLTTLRQPTREIGRRSASDDAGATVTPGSSGPGYLLQTELIVRESCGARTPSIEGAEPDGNTPTERKH